MATLWLDGFDHYGTSSTVGKTNALKGAYEAIDSTIQIDANKPRTGAGGFHRTLTSIAQWRKALPVNRDKLFMGMAHYLANITSSDGTYSFCVFRTAANTQICRFDLGSNGRVRIVNLNGGTTVVAESDPTKFLAGAWQHVECMCHVNGASGSAEVRVNGAVVASVSGIDFGSTQLNQVSAGSISAGSGGATDWWQDDLRIGDDQGGVDDDFMGDRRIFTYFPDADGSPQAWTPDTGSDAYARVDEAAPDDDTSYVQAAASGDKCTLTFPTIDAGIVAVGAVAFVSYMKKTDTGDAPYRVNVISNGQTENGDTYAPGITYQYAPQQIFNLNPDGDIPWTPAAVNALASQLEQV